ncbi:MAG: hypothetical protein B7Z74_05975 [Deltaproteobacteria bacterium 21-66-5]|nr:MAG: hypothetical protein B7Z74_05975 [Deltaproteobacteria bacterium 21-66-5]
MAAAVAPFAPRSEFAFLLMVAVVCAYATRALGVYYLVGAFLVGVAAQRFRVQLPAMSSEKMVDALEAFGSVFIPFYFFAAGTHVELQHVRWIAAGIALGFLVVITPVRILSVATHRRFALRESFAQSRRIGIALLPTLVFTLVLTGLLRTTYAAPTWLVGALVIYTVINTLVPAFVLRGQVPEFTEPLAEPAPEIEAPMP